MSTADSQAGSQSRKASAPRASALRIFTEALDVPAEDRGAFLEKASAGEGELRREVEDLFRHDARAQPEFLQPPPPSPGLDSLFRSDGPDSLIGRTIGMYAIQSVIARGGMGAVYLAAQERPHREVALKIMTSGFWSRSAQRRFEFETEILGRLHHPNIAQVYESGMHQLETGSTVPFFAMEYIPGAKAITAYCDENWLDLRARLKLFGVVCDAVHYGHQKGVVHRDLKPGNILVDEQGHVKIIDFGVARSTDSDVAVTTMHTEAGQLIGTLAYMSPEQAGGAGVSLAIPADIDTRSDVYSLGVVLFELLTGRLPYDVSHMTIHAAARVICEQEPAKPSKLKNCSTSVPSAKLRGDIDTIILKCLDKDRAKRYDSAAALAEEIERYLCGDQIAARPPTAWRRALRWAGRHPKSAALLSGLAIGVSVIAASVISVWLASSQPYRLELTLDGRTRDAVDGRLVQAGDRATLYSFSGRKLHSWSAVGGHIRFARLIPRPAKWGGGDLVALGFGELADTPYRKEVCVFDAAGPYDEPLWHRTIDQEAIDRMPDDAWPRPRFAPDRQYASGGFSVARAWLEDVFPGEDHPGEEIIVNHLHAPGSQGALRIYNLNGDLLFQVWHDGGIAEIQWLRESGVLACHAVKADKDDAAYGWKLSRNHPRVIFGLQPRPHEISQGWILPYQPVVKVFFWPMRHVDCPGCGGKLQREVTEG